MPQAASDLVAEWGGEDGIGEDKAIRYLTERGWKEVGNGMWRKPDDKDESEITLREWRALQFLIDEWDHGYKAPD